MEVKGVHTEDGLLVLVEELTVSHCERSRWRWT